MDPADEQALRQAQVIVAELERRDAAREHAIADTFREKTLIPSNPKNVYVPLSVAAAIGMAFFMGLKWSNQIEARQDRADARAEKLEKAMWTKTAQRAWEGEMRSGNPTMKVPRTAEVLKEVDD